MTSSGVSIRSQPQYAAQRSTRWATPARTQPPISPAASSRPRRAGTRTPAGSSPPGAEERSARAAHHASRPRASAELPYCT